MYFYLVISELEVVRAIDAQCLGSVLQPVQTDIYHLCCKTLSYCVSSTRREICANKFDSVCAALLCTM